MAAETAAAAAEIAVAAFDVVAVASFAVVASAAFAVAVAIDVAVVAGAVAAAVVVTSDRPERVSQKAERSHRKEAQACYP